MGDFIDIIYHLLGGVNFVRGKLQPRTQIGENTKLGIRA